MSKSKWVIRDKNGHIITDETRYNRRNDVPLYYLKIAPVWWLVIGLIGAYLFYLLPDV